MVLINHKEIPRVNYLPISVNLKSITYIFLFAICTQLVQIFVFILQKKYKQTCEFRMKNQKIIIEVD